MITTHSFLSIIIACSLIAAGCNKTITSPSPNETQVIPTKQLTTELRAPIDNWKNRISKKPFGLRVSPKNSPVSPEKFTGIHSGTDFEVFENEQTIDVPIFAICSGTILQKRTAQGYGGLVTQECTINNQVVTVSYGHMRLSSISAKTSTNVLAGEQLGVLGTGFSSETDNERKHLHLGIYRGPGTTIAGYVQSEGGLSDFINFETLLLQ